MRFVQDLLSYLLAAASVVAFGFLIGAIAYGIDWGAALLAWRIG